MYPLLTDSGEGLGALLEGTSDMNVGMGDDLQPLPSPKNVWIKPATLWLQIYPKGFGCPGCVILHTVAMLVAISKMETEYRKSERMKVRNGRKNARTPSCILE